jgi:transcriptional regulator of acetoin/glycerol metabolism
MPGRAEREAAVPEVSTRLHVADGQYWIWDPAAEAMERDAIVAALLDSHGNKAKTAESLGMSRATIYRKIHEYGIVTPAS